MKWCITFMLSITTLSVIGQGDNYVLFSKTGDTLITRTSCYCKSNDTLSTYFNVLYNSYGYLKLKSVFVVREPNKNSIPCADFNLVPKDTLAKYKLENPGRLGVKPKRFKIKTKIIETDTFTSAKGEFFYYRKVRLKYKIGCKTFYKATVWDLAKTKRQKTEKPRIKQVFGSRILKKYHFVSIQVSSNIDRKTGSIKTTHSHIRILN